MTYVGWLAPDNGEGHVLNNSNILIGIWGYVHYLRMLFMAITAL